MKKIAISLLIIFSAIFLIGLFGKKNEFTIKQNTNNQQNSEKPAENKDNNTPQTDKDILITIQDKISNDLESLTSKLTPDKNKSVDNYNEEINQLMQKYKTPDSQNLDADYFLNIAKELAKINPPVSLYKNHIEFIRYYYTTGFILKEIQQTNDIPEKIILTEYLKTYLEKIKSPQ